jgi:uncharacterized protein (TIGR02145 family)
MKTNILILLLVIIRLDAFSQLIDSIVDQRDGKVYKTVKIGTQIWMAENLNYVTDTGSICYDNQPSNCNIFGRLYTWEVAKQVCPQGWHLPSDNEWQMLERVIGMDENELNSTGFRGGDDNIAAKLKARVYWDSTSNLNCEDIGFNVLPAGNYGFHEKIFGLLYCNAFFWTSTPYNDKFAWNRDIRDSDNTIFRSQKYKRVGFSVRCVRNE